MTALRYLILGALLLLSPAALAAPKPQTTNQFTVPSTGTTAYLGATVGGTHGQVLAGNLVHVYLMLFNPSAPGGNTVYCSFGGTATVSGSTGGAGTVGIAPGQYVTWESSYAPLDAIDCIATGSSTPFTIGYQ